jgi:hypothetical protein
MEPVALDKSSKASLPQRVRSSCSHPITIRMKEMEVMESESNCFSIAGAVVC